MEVDKEIIARMMEETKVMTHEAICSTLYDSHACGTQFCI